MKGTQKNVCIYNAFAIHIIRAIKGEIYLSVSLFVRFGLKKCYSVLKVNRRDIGGSVFLFVGKEIDFLRESCIVGNVVKHSPQRIQKQLGFEGIDNNSRSVQFG